MKYIILSDLHIPERANVIPPEILEISETVDGLICAGDFTTKEIFDKLKAANKNLIAVKGNCDCFELPEYSVFFKEGYKIGVIHSDIFGRDNSLLIEEFAKSEYLDIIIFGHTHQPFLEKRDDLIMINPGSTNGIPSGHGHPSEKTYAILNIEYGNPPKAEIRKID